MKRRFIPHGFLFLALVGLISCGAGRPGKNAPDTAAAATSKSSPSAIATTPSSDRFGVMAVPADKRSPKTIEELGVGWVRFSSQMGDASRAKREAETFRQVSSLGFKMWLTISHRDRANMVEEGTIGFAKTPRGGFEPRDPERYKALVRETIRPLVDSLKRQGKRPGDWLVVQIENEVLPADLGSPDKAQRFWHGTAGGYISTLALAYDAVKSVDPTIQVALFGFSSEMLGEFVDGRRRLLVSWGERVLSEGKYDLADVHLYNRIEDIPAKVGWVRARTNRPVSATEVGGPDPAEGEDPSDDEALAGELPIRMRAVLDVGAERAFWVMLVETKGADERFQKMGLIDARWRRRPAYEAYQKLIRGEP